jgi:Ni,Fe-hydrogenase III small subunit
LDNWWELSPAGYRYYERARKEGRHRILRHYDTLIDRYGKLYCHLPNQIGRVEIPRQEITNVSVTTCAANGHVQFHIKDNHMIEIDEFVSVEVQTPGRVQRFYSISSGINTLVRQLG